MKKIGLNSKVPDGVVQRILQALQNIRYGSVEIIIHNSEVVQIEQREKHRFDQANSIRK